MSKDQTKGECGDHVLSILAFLAFDRVKTLCYYRSTIVQILAHNFSSGREKKKDTDGMTNSSSPPLELFYCYAPEDRKLLDELDKHLSTLRKGRRIIRWYDGATSPGVNQKQEMKAHLDTARIILLLISPDFLNSDDHEEILQYALERHQRGEARVVPVLLRPVIYKSSLSVLPSNGRAVTRWENQDEAFEDVAGDISRVVEELSPQPPMILDRREDPDPPPTTPTKPTVPPRYNQEHLRPKPTVTSRQLSTRSKLFLSLLIVLILCTALGTFAWFLSRSTLHSSSISDGTTPISTWMTPSGELVGISDGGSTFDTNRLDGFDKSEAAKKFMAGDTTGAQSLWQKAIQEDSSDAEALIYQENQRVLASRKSYSSLVVATILTGDNAHVGRDDLQGAYVAQREFNAGLKLHGGMQIRLLIANSGSSDESVASSVAQHIVQAASTDNHIVGVMGWPFSQSTLNAVNILAKAHIPMIAQTAATDELTGISPYFFRVIPPDRKQGAINAQYVAQTLHAKRVAIFVDDKNPYSSDFANDFREPYLADGIGDSIVDTEKYTVGSQGQDQLHSLLQNALSFNPDVIYFAGYANDLNVLLTDLPSSGPGTKVQVVGGEGLYELGGYTSSARAHFGQLHFLAYAYPDEWDEAGLTTQKPLFFQEYSNAFNPSGQNPPQVYGYVRADNDVIVSYDATLALFTGINFALSSQGTKRENITPDKLQHALTQINSSQPLQGVSGQIAFGSDGDPINKVILIVYVDREGHFMEESLHGGCLLVGHCS